MKSLLLLLLLPTLASASKGAAVPVPKDPQGGSPALAKSAVMGDGTWVVSDTAGRVWWSRDLGGRWDSVARSPSGSRAEIFGEVVSATDEKSVWTYDAGWRSTVFPDVCTRGSNRYTSSDGILGIYDDKAKTITYCRSIDGLRTWTVWFSPPNESLPSDTLRWIGQYWNNKIWYTMGDSGYARGTADGLSWARIPLPSVLKAIDFVPVTKLGSELVVVGGATRWTGQYVASSSDMGASWDIRSVRDPGNLVRRIADHLFFTTTRDSLDGRRYGVSETRNGPWTMFDTAYRGLLNNGDDAYVVEERAIYKLVLDGVGRRSKPVVTSWRVRIENGRMVVDLPSALVGSSWSLRALDGRKLAGGKVAGDRLELPPGVPGGLLSVGSLVRMVPAFVP